MSLETLAQIGESAGLFAVLVTLVYLAIQLRHHNRELRDQTAWRITESIQAFAGALVDPAIAQVWCDGNDDFDSLSRVDRERFIVLVASWHNVLMALYRTKGTSAIPAEYWDQAVSTFAIYYSQYDGFRKALGFVNVPADLLREIEQRATVPASRPTSGSVAAPGSEAS